MKDSLKLGILVIVACVCSIFIYYNVDKVKPVNNSQSLINKQYKLEKSFLNDTNYNYKDPKVIIDPYDISPLSALIIFETKDLTAPTVTISGKDSNSTFTHTFTPSKKHLLPIYGLYADYNNEVLLKVNNEIIKIHIKTDKLPDKMVLPTTVKADKTKLGNELYFVTPSSAGYTSAYDVNGDVRWFLTSNTAWDINRLKNGNIMLGTERLINPPYYTTGLYEMDLLGKIYYEYSLPGGYHHDVYELNNGNLLVASDNFSNGTVEDYIVEVDRLSGEIVKEFDLMDILPTTDGKSASWTEYDWFHNNSVWYDEKTNSITLSGRHQDAVINIDYNTKELNWIVGDSTNWSSEMQKYFFKKTDNTEWQFSQHAAMILPNGNLFVFDNGNNRSKNKDEYISASNNYSRGVIYEFNINNKTINQVYEYGKARGKFFYSPYISDVDYISDNQYLIHSGGIAIKDNEPLNTPAGLGKSDYLNSVTVEVLNNVEIFEMQLPSNYYRSEKLSLYSNNTYKPGKGIVLGNMGKTTTSKKKPILLFNKSIDKNYEEKNISIIKESDRLNITGTFKKDDKVQIILSSLFKNISYDMPISKKPYTAMCIDIFNDKELKDGIGVSKYINNIGLKGKYNIYIKINNTIYDTDLYVKY